MLTLFGVHFLENSDERRNSINMQWVSLLLYIAYQPKYQQNPAQPYQEKIQRLNSKPYSNILITSNVDAPLTVIFRLDGSTKKPYSNILITSNVDAPLTVTFRQESLTSIKLSLQLTAKKLWFEEEKTDHTKLPLTHPLRVSIVLAS